MDLRQAFISFICGAEEARDHELLHSAWWSWASLVLEEPDESAWMGGVNGDRGALHHHPEYLQGTRSGDFGNQTNVCSVGTFTL